MGNLDFLVESTVEAPKSNPAPTPDSALAHASLALSNAPFSGCVGGGGGGGGTGARISFVLRARVGARSPSVRPSVSSFARSGVVGVQNLRLGGAD